jgi:hypothetical protein
VWISCEGSRAIRADPRENDGMKHKCVCVCPNTHPPPQPHIMHILSTRIWLGQFVCPSHPPNAYYDDGRMNYLLHMIGAMLVIFRIELLIPDSWP